MPLGFQVRGFHESIITLDSYRAMEILYHRRFFVKFRIMKMIAVRVTTKEWEQILLRAAKEGMYPSAWLRTLAGLLPVKRGGPRPGAGRRKKATEH